MLKKSSGFIFMFLLFLTGCMTDKIPPEINYIQHNAVISPNGDGVQDELVFDLSIKDTSDVKYWKLEIFNEKNEIVKVFTSGGTLEEALKKIFFKKGSVEIPEQIKWDGTDNNGKPLPDGKYGFRFVAMDGDKNVTPNDAVTGTVIIDTKKPEVKTTVGNKLFNPTNESDKNVLNIDINIIQANVKNKVLDADFRQIWYVDIINAKGDVVRRYQYTDKGEYKIAWDGRDDKGDRVPDGAYKVKVYSTNSGGTYWEQVVSDIVIDSKPTPVKVSASEEYFSPNGDGVRDTVTFSFDVPVKNNFLNWTMDILNSKGKSVKSYSGDSIPSPITWDGRDDSKNVLPEDTYKAVFKANYANGNAPGSESKPFTLDVTEPTASVTLSSDIFSPGSNGPQDQLTILQNTSKKGDWKGTIYDEKGNVVKTFIWESQPPKKIDWDGKDNNNNTVKDGVYYYQLTAVDYAGNPYKSEKMKTRVYTAEIPASIIPKFDYFAPGQDSLVKNEVFELKYIPSKENPATDWKLVINNSTDKPVYETDKTGDVPPTIDWDGMTSANKYITGGSYYAVFTINFKAGTTTSAKSKVFYADLEPPVVKFTTEPKYFSPDDDGSNDTLNMQLKLDDPSGIKNWKISILDPFTKNDFKTFSGDGNPPESLTWDGKSTTGELVESAQDYPVKINAEDNVGNKIEKMVDPIMIDILIEKLPDGRLKVRVSNIKFMPDSPQMTFDPKNREVLDLLAKALNKYPQHIITLEGYANKYAENLNETAAKDLSLKRAQTVVRELSKRGVKTNRMKIVGRGFDNPIIPLKPHMSKEEQQEMEKNRRVEFYLEKN